MIGHLIDSVRQRVAFADALVTADETLTVSLGHSGEEVAQSVTRQTHLRVEDEGRIGSSTRTDGQAEGLIESAILSARHGSEGRLLAPAPSPTPETFTAVPATAALGVQELLGIARQLNDRLTRSERTVDVWAERSIGRVDVANTHGVMTGYDATVAGLGVHLNFRAGDSTGDLRLHAAANSVPDEPMLAELVGEVEQRLAPPLLDRDPPAGPVNVWLSPRAVAAVLVPVCQALIGRNIWVSDGRSPFHAGEPLLSSRLTLHDDALAPARPGSRPVDDEGVVCRRQTLIRDGVLLGALADLATAARLGIPPTGHGRRAAGAPAWTGWSNVVLDAGDAAEPELARATGDGVMIRDLPRPVGRCDDGQVVLATSWAYQVSGGEITGRYERAVLKGNVFEWLNRVLAVGANARWIGARCLPDLVVEGVEFP
jgi:predicted Zn-dependent protease